MQSTVYHGGRHCQAGKEHILRHRVFDIIVQCQPMTERRNHRPHQQHTEYAQTQAKPNALHSCFADFFGFTCAVQLGNHRVQCGHYAHKSNVDRRKRAAAQSYRGQIFLACAAGHHRVDKTNAHLRHLRQQHRQGEGGKQAGFF